MIKKAREKLRKALDIMPITSVVGEQIAEAIEMLDDYMNADNVIAFVMEHYTTEQIVKRCRNAIIEKFGDDYREFIIRLENR